MTPWVVVSVVDVILVVVSEPPMKPGVVLSAVNVDSVGVSDPEMALLPSPEQSARLYPVS